MRLLAPVRIHKGFSRAKAAQGQWIIMTTAFPDYRFSRRAVLRGSAAAGAALAIPAPLLGQERPVTITRWPAVAALIEDYVGTSKVANMVAAMGWGDSPAEYLAQGNTSFTSGAGVGPDTLYRIYSMTKPLTAMAAMLCIEDGLLDLDQPIAEILPAFADMRVQKTYDGSIAPADLEPAVRPITVRQCLTHTSGLGYTIVQEGPISRAYADAGIVPGAVTRLDISTIFSGKPAASLEAFADNLATLPLVHQPGTRWSYSVGLDLIGRVIEVVSGQSFDGFLGQRILDPCGMDSTSFRVSQSQAERLTANYVVFSGNLLPIDLPQSSVFLDAPAFPFGGAGLVSSARDYDRFLQMLANYGEIDGNRVMAEATVRLATSDLLPDTIAPGGGFSFGERAFGYGAGGLVGRGDAEGLYGWFGAAGTAGLVNMRLGLRHNLMTQFMPAQAYPLMEQFPLAVAADAGRLLQS